MSFVAPLLLAVTLLSFSCFLVVGLISVPWPVLLVVLVLGLFMTQRVLGDPSELDGLIPAQREDSFLD